MISNLASSIERLKRVTGGSRNCGWMCDEVAFLLYAMVKFFKPEVLIQTGHLWGKSATVVLEAMTDGFLAERGGLETEFQNADQKFATFLKEHSPIKPRSPRVISVDPEPMGVEHWHAGVELLQKSYPGAFQFKQMTSAAFFADFQEDLSGQRLMGIVDGDHSPEGCRFDLEHLARLNAKVILVDDTNWLPKLKPVAESFARERGYNFINLDLYNGVGLLTK